ncbi:MAG: TIGR03936 family radical SAM-associated protein [Bacillota bacterium]|jgi:radical SAM-linked protein
MLIRLEYSRCGTARFLSHLEMLRLFERSFRRASLPLAFSRGFNPHPKISFGPPLPVGVSGRREYLDVELKEKVPLDTFLERLHKKLPQGIILQKAKEISAKAPALMAVIERAGYRVQVPLKGPLTDARLQEAINLLLEKKSIIIYRRTKRGSQEKDIREGIYHLTGEITAKEAALQMELGIAGKLAVRPEEIVQLLAEEEALPLEPKMARIERTGLFVFKEGRRLSPLEDLDR